jgi:hypothetical protein
MTHDFNKRDLLEERTEAHVQRGSHNRPIQLRPTRVDASDVFARKGKLSFISRRNEQLGRQMIGKVPAIAFVSCIIAAAFFLGVASAEQIEVGRGVLVRASVNKSQSVQFCLDTGFSGSAAVSEHLSKQLGLSATGSTEISDPSGRGAARVATVRLNRLSIAGIDRLNVEAAVQPDGPMTMACEGVVGLPFFKGRLLTLDMENGQLEAATGTLRPNDPDVLPYTSEDGIPQVTVKAGNSDIAADIDTMSQGFSLPTAWALKLHLESPLQVIGMGRTVSGEFEIRGAVVEDEVTVGPYNFKGSFMEFNSRFQKATIGLSALRHFALTFDQESGLVRLRAARRDITIAAPKMRTGP